MQLSSIFLSRHLSNPSLKNFVLAIEVFILTKMKQLPENNKSVRNQINNTIGELINAFAFVIDSRFNSDDLITCSLGSEELDLYAVQFLLTSVNYLDINDANREETITLYINQVIPTVCRLLLSYSVMSAKVQLVSGMAFTKLAQLYPNVFKNLIGSSIMNETVNNVTFKTVLQQTMMLAMQQTNSVAQSNSTATTTAPLKKLDMSKYKK